MSRLLIAIALLVPAPPLGSGMPLVPAVPRHLCVPPPPRTTPHRHLERVDKWQHDERTIA